MEESRVVVVDLQMPFWSMVIFMVKAAIAFIPAFIILTILGLLFASLIGGFIVGMTGQ